jgi:hypothetical protein
MPCVDRQVVALPPHGHESESNAIPPATAQIVETAGATTGTLPPYVEDYSPPLRRRLPWRPMAQADESWLGATAPSLRPLGWM